MAQICTSIRPAWDGMPVSTLSEFIILAGAPVSLVLLALSLLCLRTKSQWGTLAVVVAWSLYVSFLTLIDPGGILASGRAAGCVGSPALFITAVTAICIAMILYTAPKQTRAN